MRPYPAYKESGVKWLGEVPEGWEVKRLRQIVRLQTEKATTTENPIALENIEGWSGRIIETDTEFEGSGVAFDAGDILFGKLRPYLAKVAVAETSGEAVGDFHVLRPSASVLPRFLQLGLLTPSVISTIDSSTYGSKMPRVSWDFMADLRFPLPPFPEQQAIASFLDRETAKIDGLIEEQRRLIALLAEKRQATISHAVTKGLNPNARLKPSGIDWLGDVPEGWGVARIAQLFADTVEAGNDDLPILSVSIHTGVSDSELSDEDMDRKVSRSADKSKYISVQPGDLTYNMMRAWQGGFGTVKVKGMVSPAYIVARPLPSAVFETEFIELMLRTPFAVTEIKRHSRGITDFRLRLYWDEFKNIRVALPPLEEQVSILRAIGEMNTQYDALTETATSAIALLQERRAALISAVVTGKIDVREAVTAPARCLPDLEVSALVLGAVIANHLQQDGFGRMMTQKYLFLIQTGAKVHEIGGNFLRDAAGPYDGDLRKQAEKALEKAGLVRVSQDGGHGSRVEYEFLGDAAALRADLESALSDRMERFNYLSSRLGKLNKKEIEAVATLYAAWNDFLIDGHTPEQDEIIREVLENWHEEKPKRFKADELKNWLGWMERQDIVPDGTGPRTRQGRLFV